MAQGVQRYNAARHEVLVSSDVLNEKACVAI